MLNQGSGGLDVKPVPAKNLAQFDAQHEEAVIKTDTISEEETSSEDDPQSSSTDNDDESTEVESTTATEPSDVAQADVTPTTDANNEDTSNNGD